MTSFAFILGVLPLVLASGPGWELRQALGTAVFFGMIGVTAFGLIFTPVFYVACRALGERLKQRRGAAPRRRAARAAAGGIRNRQCDLKQFTTLASALALAACASGRTMPARNASAAAGPFIAANSPAVQPLAPVQGDWWRLYNDPVLDGLIADALAHNTDVRAAVARLARARAALQRGQGRPPAAGRRQRRRDPRPRRRTRPMPSTSFDAGLDIAMRSTCSAASAAMSRPRAAMSAAAEADAEAVRVAIVAETARAYADAASAAERLAVATHIVELLDQSLKLTERRVEIGLNSRLDTARIATLRNQRQAEIPAIAAERDNALFRLAMLTGRAPAELPQAAGARTISLKLDRPIPVGDGAAAARPPARRPRRRTAARGRDGADRRGNGRTLPQDQPRRIAGRLAPAASAICSATRSASCLAR